MNNSWKTSYESTYHALYLVEIHKKQVAGALFCLHQFTWEKYIYSTEISSPTQTAFMEFGVVQA